MNDETTALLEEAERRGIPLTPKMQGLLAEARRRKMIPETEATTGGNIKAGLRGAAKGVIGSTVGAVGDIGRALKGEDAPGEKRQPWQDFTPQALASKLPTTGEISDFFGMTGKPQNMQERYSESIGQGIGSMVTPIGRGGKVARGSIGAMSGGVGQAADEMDPDNPLTRAVGQALPFAAQQGGDLIGTLLRVLARRPTQAASPGRMTAELLQGKSKERIVELLKDLAQYGTSIEGQRQTE